ncbi:zinc-dependent metalloprotease [Aquimarina addita]|uniref:Zinc-dependent metalloprotease n=1 Tax=Aquimarina addita TaxID=870485 RepID=A0ABP6USN2_9FLAO
MKFIVSNNKFILIAFLCILGIGIQHTEAQSKKKKLKKGTSEQVDTGKKEKNEKTIKELTKKSEKIEGLFTMYRDTIDGTTKMLIHKDQIGKEFIYFSQITDGVADAGAFRGAYLDSKIFKIEKHFDKIEFIQKNVSFYFDENNALSKSSGANVSDGILASLTIEAQDDKKENYLITSDALFIKETFNQIKRPAVPGASPFSFKLGNLSEEKTKIKKIQNYPENLNIQSHYVYSKSSILNKGSNAVVDGRNITIKVAHSLIAMPENDYQPRFDDPRVGYFTTQVTDMTSKKVAPYRDLIHRWNLVKKDPTAKISEPVQPIVWWIENSTPLEFRASIKQGVLEWNKAFEKAGFKNAIVVKTQPDDATWDAGDIRYNVLRWTSSPAPRFGGYGPSFVNPRTGEILGADIMLEYVHHTNRVRIDKIFNLNETNTEYTPINNTHAYCSFGEMTHENTLFGQTALKAFGSSIEEIEGMKKEAMINLIMHEVGHTLGLNHNMKSSQLFSPAQLYDPAFIKGKSLTGSVMDYEAINVTIDKANQGHFYSEVLGPYDDWAIQFGYSQIQSPDELDLILAKSIQPELSFGNDADDMRSPGKGIDPRVMTGDLSNDQITYSIDRIKLVTDILKDLKSQFNQPGETYQELLQAFFILKSQYGRAGDVISRFIGGVYVDRSTIGQNEAMQPFTPVSYSDQKRAMQALSDYIFAPNAFDTPAELYNYLAAQRRGFNFFSNPEDPRIHKMVLGYQKRVLDHILHPNTLQRITDSELYGNTYALSEFMTDLNSSIFKADVAGSINTFRQNLQLEYVKKLIKILFDTVPKSDSKRKQPPYTYAAKSMALYNLKSIKSMVSNNTGNILSKAHKDHLKTLINNSIDAIK